MIKKKMDKLLSFCVGSKAQEARALLREITDEKFNDGKYQGQCETLEFLGISPAEWSDLKKKKQ
jgi:hypothetical protein